MKEKVLIMMNSMGIGGVEKALLNLLSILDKERFDVTVLFVRKDGEYLKKLAMWVNVEEMKISDFERNLLDFGSKAMIGETLKKYKYISTVKIIISYLKRKIISKMRGNNDNPFEEMFKYLPEYPGHYDVALDFFGHTSFTTYYISEKVNADIKATWLHSSDFGEDIRKFSTYYNKYNRIYGVSKACVGKFSAIYPEYADKCETFYNILLSDDIKKKAEQDKGFDDDFNGIKILSVGRLSVAKGFDVAIAVASRLKKEGFKFKWYVIGEGLERTRLEKLIQHYGVDDCFILFGASDNPYPYIKQCDIYVQPSRFEGYCITLAEARILKKSIITTNFFGAQEQIVDGETGLIIDFDEVKIYEAIKKLFTDTLLRNKFEENLSKEKIDTSNEIKKLYAFLDEGPRNQKYLMERLE